MKKYKLIILTIIIIVLSVSVFTACGDSNVVYSYETVCYCDCNITCPGCEEMSAFYNLDKEVVSMSSLNLSTSSYDNNRHRHLYVCYKN